MQSLAKRLTQTAEKYRANHRPKRIDGRLFYSPADYESYLLHGSFNDCGEPGIPAEFIHDDDHKLWFVHGPHIEGFGGYLCHWHSGMDAIYAAGSSIIAGGCDWWTLKRAMRLLAKIKGSSPYDEAERRALLEIGRNALRSWPDSEPQYLN